MQEAVTLDPSVTSPIPLAGGDKAGLQKLIELQGASVVFGRGTKALKALEATLLTVQSGEFVALVGPSGCGKSTILKLVSGLLEPSSGVVIVGGREVAARRVQVGMAFQNPTMLPWLTVRDNIMLPLKIVAPYKHDFRTKRKTEYLDKVEALLRQVGLSGFGTKYPWQLSGGMLQRASLCRALIHEPQLLLLDEPFGALDQFTREELWGALQSLWLSRKPTVLLVTHDLREAVFLANRIVVMSARPGRVIDDDAVTYPYPRTIEQTYEPSFVARMQRLRGLIFGSRAQQERAPA